MHQLDALILRNAAKSLERALEEMKDPNRFRGELLAALSVSFALSDLKCVLGAPLEETE